MELLWVHPSDPRLPTFLLATMKPNYCNWNYCNANYCICSPEQFQLELDKIKSILLDNGYPEYIINSYMTKKNQQFHTPPKFDPEKCPVYLHLPWLGLVSNQFEKQVTSSVKHCYLTVEPHVVYKTNQLLPVANKDMLPVLQNSNVIYPFSCHCDSRYGPHFPKTTRQN